jgi:uncharacterized membrane protein required for colicin V production
MSGPAWPDIALGGLLVLGALRGFKRGLVRELAGAAALAAAIAAGFTYRGGWDGFARSTLHADPAYAHVAACVLWACAAYAGVLAAAALLGRIAKLPVINAGNALLGAAVGLTKSAIFAWSILYVALFFPLSHALRHDLHDSRIVQALQMENPAIDAAVRGSIPGFVRPYAASLFERHRV